MTVPNVFDLGDGLDIAYVSPAFPNLASAQKHACLELLCFLLVTAPTKVIMHPHEYLNQLTSIEQLRAQGQEVRVVYLQLVSPAFGGSTSGISMAERITDMLPRERPPSKRSTFHVPKFLASCDTAARFGRRRVGCLCHQYSPRSPSPWAMVSGRWAPHVGLATFEGVLAQEWAAAVSPAASHSLRGQLHRQDKSPGQAQVRIPSCVPRVPRGSLWRQPPTATTTATAAVTARDSKCFERQPATRATTTTDTTTKDSK